MSVSFVERNCEPAVPILSVADFVKTFSQPPDWLEKSWNTAKRRGLDKLSLDGIDSIGAYRREKRDSG